MYIKLRPVAIVCRLSIGVLAGFSTWLLLQIFGDEAWRLYPAWVMSIAAVYYILNALVALLSRRRNFGRMVCPMLQGVIIIAGLTIIIFRTVFNANQLKTVGLEGVGMALVDYILPALFLLDWVLFTKKGHWHAIDPYYWLALPTCYAACILISAEFINTESVFRYPYGFLNFYAIGLDLMLIWFMLIAVVILVLGYALVILDFVMSGKLAKYIVLPRIKTIVIEEEIPATSIPTVREPVAKSAPQKNSKVEKTPAKDIVGATKPVKTAQAKKTVKTPAKTSNSPAKKTHNSKPGGPQAKAKKQPVALLEAEASSVKAKALKDSKTSSKPKKTDS